MLSLLFNPNLGGLFKDSFCGESGEREGDKITPLSKTR